MSGFFMEFKFQISLKSFLEIMEQQWQLAQCQWR